jgi:uncharacterized protein with GYD domain
LTPDPRAGIIPAFRPDQLGVTQMPIGMYRLSTAAPPHQGNPKGLQDFVAAAVESVGARLVDIYFDIGRDQAIAIVEGLDDYVDVKAVSTLLRAEGFEKYVRVEQAAEAIARHDELSASAD